MQTRMGFCRVAASDLAVCAEHCNVRPEKAADRRPAQGRRLRRKEFQIRRTANPFLKSACTTPRSERRNATPLARVTNAVVVLHGTNRAGNVFLVPSFAGVLFGPGQLLDTSKYYVILPDQLGGGLGKSTKPSDGLRAKFPHYDYADMLHATQIAAERRLAGESPAPFHRRLRWAAWKASCGAKRSRAMWTPIMLLSCLPVQVAGRNRMVRKIMIDDVRDDPGWNNGNYTQQPYGLRAALGHLLVVGSAPTLWQEEYGTAALADKYVDNYIAENMKSTDANDFIYQYDASRNYDPNQRSGQDPRSHVPGERDGRFLESRRDGRGRA